LLIRSETSARRRVHTFLRSGLGSRRTAPRVETGVASKKRSAPINFAVHSKLREAVLSGLLAAVLILPIGVVSYVAREPLLFPSLGPTVFIQVHSPRSQAARPWNNLVGHGVGVLAAVVALWLTGDMHGHSSAQAQSVVTLPRELAAAIAVGLATMDSLSYARRTRPGRRRQC